MSKLKIIDKKSEKSINSEREFLTKLRHPFIVNMHYAFQDNDNLYLVMDLLPGGDLRFHITKNHRFSEEQTRFFIGCMIIALEYIHNNNVIHRDIKPENLVLDDKGYVRITDFGIAKENCPDNSSETSGTPGYMSPEVMRGKNHSFPVDFFAIGVIGYEFMNGVRPYVGANKREIKDQILSRQVMIKHEDIRPGWSTESADFINKLLKRKPEQRLGCENGVRDLMEHSWLKYYPWKELRDKSLPSPYIPEKKDNFDRGYCEYVDKIGETTKMRYREILFEKSYKTAFSRFFYNKEELINKSKKINKEILKDNNQRIVVKTSSLSSKHIKQNSTMLPHAGSPLNSNNIVISPSTSRGQKKEIKELKQNKRPLSHSYSTKDVKQQEQEKYLTKNNNVGSINLNNGYNTNFRKNKNGLTSPINNNSTKKNTCNNKYSGQRNQNLLNLLFENNNNVGSNTSSKTSILKSHARSSSLMNSSNRKSKEYANKLSSMKSKTKKNKLNRADSASTLFTRSVSQYLFNKIKPSSFQGSKYVYNNKNMIHLQK